MTERSRLPGLQIAALALIAAGLGGCAGMRQDDVTGSLPTDYRQRHPIILREAPRHLDIFASRGASLDARQEADVIAFAGDYRRNGRGGMVAYVPDSPGGRQGLAGVRNALAHAGLAGHRLSVVSYVPDDPTTAAPVRLSFSRLQAQVDSQCDDWRQDVAQSDRMASWQNVSYPNFGCSYQKNLAAQVADPRDLVGPRAEDPADAQMRTRGIEDMRKGSDPTRNWKTKNSTISTVGAEQ